MGVDVHTSLHTPLPVPWWRRFWVGLAVAATLHPTVVMLGGSQVTIGRIMLFSTAVLAVPLVFRLEDYFRIACAIAGAAVPALSMIIPIMPAFVYHLMPALVLVGVAVAGRSWWSWIPLVLAAGGAVRILLAAYEVW